MRMQQTWIHRGMGLCKHCKGLCHQQDLTTEGCCHIHQHKYGEAKGCCNGLHPCGRKQTVLRSGCMSSTTHSVISHLIMLWTADPDPLQGLQKLCGQRPDSLVDPPEESVESEVSVVEQPKMTEPTARYKNSRVQRYSAQQACTATTRSATPSTSRCNWSAKQKSGIDSLFYAVRTFRKLPVTGSTTLKGSRNQGTLPTMGKLTCCFAALRPAR